MKSYHVQESVSNPNQQNYECKKISGSHSMRRIMASYGEIRIAEKPNAQENHGMSSAKEKPVRPSGLSNLLCQKTGD